MNKNNTFQFFQWDQKCFREDNNKAILMLLGMI